MADKIYRYIDCNVPVMICNFKCEYCSVVQRQEFGSQFQTFPYPPQHIAKALSPERLGGVCMLNFCGNGETLLHPQIIDLLNLVLKSGHYVSVVTNGTISHAVDAMCNFPADLRERIFIKFSFHYNELLRLNMLQRFFDNIKKAKSCGISFTVELVACDNLTDIADEIKACCMNNLGALCHVTDPRDNSDSELRRLTTLPISEHQAIWRTFDSGLFEYQQKTWGVNRKDHFCYGGVWGFVLSLGNGNLRQCENGLLQNIFIDIDEPIHELAVGNECPYSYCFHRHVWDCFADIIPDIQSPPYSSLRNRKCADGSEWLTPAYKKIFDRKVSSNRNVFDACRKAFNNGLMLLEFRENEPENAFKYAVQKYLNELETVLIFGKNKIAQWLVANIEKARFYTDSEAGDLIIVTDYKHFAEIKKEFSNLAKTKIISVADLPTLMEPEAYESAY